MFIPIWWQRTENTTIKLACILTEKVVILRQWIESYNNFAVNECENYSDATEESQNKYDRRLRGYVQGRPCTKLLATALWFVSVDDNSCRSSWISNLTLANSAILKLQTPFLKQEFFSSITCKLATISFLYLEEIWLLFFHFSFSCILKLSKSTSLLMLFYSLIIVPKESYECT